VTIPRVLLFFLNIYFKCITLYISYWKILITFVDSCRRRPLWSISQSASIVCDTRPTTADVWSDSYTSYGKSSARIAFLFEGEGHQILSMNIDFYLDVSTNVRTRISFAILPTRISLAILSAISCNNSILSCYATRPCKTYHYGTCKYRCVFL